MTTENRDGAFTLEIRRKYLKGARKKPWTERRFYRNGNGLPGESLRPFYLFRDNIGGGDPSDNGGVDLIAWFEATRNIPEAEAAYLNREKPLDQP